MKRRAVSFLTVLALCLSLCPMRALAASGTDQGSVLTQYVSANTTAKTTYVVKSSLKIDTQGYRYAVSGETAVRVQSPGRLYLTRGTIESENGAGIEVQTGCFLYVDDPGMTVAGTTYGLDLASGTTIRLSGGTFKGGDGAIRVEDGDYAALLASTDGTRYAYFDENGDPITLFEANGNQITVNVTREKTLVVKACTDHGYDYMPNNGDVDDDGDDEVAHSRICKYCGTPAEPELCTFLFDETGYAECGKCGQSIQITISQPSGDLDYNGGPQPDDVTVTVMLDVTTTLTEDKDYTVEYTAGENAGEVIAVTVTGSAYTGSYTKKFGIIQAQPVITWDNTDPVAVDYDGDPVEAADLPGVNITAPKAENLRGFYYSYRKTGDAGFTAGLPTDAGTYEIKANLPEQPNYKEASSAPITLTIKKINPVITAPEAENLTYNGGAQELVTRGEVWDGAVVLFATSQDGPWSTAVPTGTNAESYTVYYKIDGTNNYNPVEATPIENVKIQRKEVKPDVQLEYSSYVYTGGEIEPAVTVRDPDTWVVLPTSEYAVEYSNNTNVGSKDDPAVPPTVTVTGKNGGNYDIITAEVKFDITPKDQDGLTIINQPSAVAYGDVFVLGTSGGSGNGTVTWKITAVKDGGGNDIAPDRFDETAVVDAGGQVTVTGLGTVTVQATKTGTDYKEATAEWEFTVGPKHVTATVTAANKTYDGNNTASVTAVVERSDLVLPGDTITITGLSGADLTGTFSDPNAGTNKTVTLDISKVEVGGDGTILGGTGNTKYIVTVPKTTTADIAKAATTVTDPTKRDRVYDGTEQALLSAGAAASTETGVTVEVEYALGAGGRYSAYIPQATDAGDYEVWYRVQETDNYFGTTAKKVVVTVSPKEVAAVVGLSQNSYTYDGTEKRPAVTVKESTAAPDNIPASEYTVSYSNNVSSGTATVTVTDNPGGNYVVSGTATFTINKADAVLTVTPQAVAGLNYNGQAQNLVTAGSATGGSLMYSPTENGTYTAAIPKETNAGEYKVYYKVAGDGNHNGIDTPSVVYVTIQPKTVISPVITLNGEDTNGLYSVTYTGAKHEPGVASVLDGADTVPSTEYDVTYSGNINAGTATVHIVDKNGGNYTVNGSKTFTIEKAPAGFAENGKPKAKALTYSGKAQTLIDAGVPNGGTAVYALDDENGPYFETLPTGTGRGEYTVYAKVLGDGNHLDSAPIKIEGVKIDPKPVAPTVKCYPSIFPYDGTEKTPNIIVTDDDGGEIPASEYTVDFDTQDGTQDRTAVGTYTVTVTARTGGNYTFTTAGNMPVTGSFEIRPADQAPLSIVTDKAPAVCYGDTFKLSAVGGSGTGAVKWRIESGGTNAAAVDPDTGVVTVKGTGSFTVTAYREGTAGSYDKSNEDSMTFEAKAKPVTPVITVTDKNYDGTKTASLTAGWNRGDMVGSDDITITVTGEFVTADVGTGKQVTIITKAAAGGTGTNVNNYDITYPDTVTGSIYKVDAELATVPKAARTEQGTGLIYNAAEQNLITGGATKDNIGKVEYSLNEKGAYSEEIPTAREAGTYTVWYRVAESVNWTGIGPVSVEVTIGKATPDITVKPTASAIYPNQPLSKSDLTPGKATFNGVEVPGAYAWKDSEIQYKQGESYEVIFTPYDTVNFKPVTIEIKIGEDAAEEPSGDSGNTGTTPGGAGTQPGTESASTQTTVRDGTASTVVSAAAGDRLANEAVASQSKNVVIKPEITGYVTKTEVSIPASAVSRIGNETDASLTVSTPVADVTIPNGALGTLSGAGGTVSIVTEQVGSTVVLTLTAGGRDVGDLPTGLTLTVPAEDAGPGTVAVLVYADGTRETVRKSVAGDGGVRIPLSGSATVEIVDNSKVFADVPAENWAADAIAFASAHEMFNGTSATTFSPELSMSRAMMATVLYNLESNPDTAFNGAFADVRDDIWYAGGVSWAANHGIVTGYDNGSFGANDSITREQLAVMLWRYAGRPAADGQALNFTDAEQASGYAVEALRWAAANGILKGYGNGRLDPAGQATRAQAAQMLKNFIENT